MRKSGTTDYSTVRFTLALGEGGVYVPRPEHCVLGHGEFRGNHISRGITRKLFGQSVTLVDFEESAAPVTVQRKVPHQQAGCTLLTTVPPPRSGGGQAAEVYRLTPERHTLSSGSYRVIDNASQVRLARGRYVNRARPGQQMPFVTIVSFGLIVMSMVVGFLAVALL